MVSKGKGKIYFVHFDPFGCSHSCLPMMAIATAGKDAVPIVPNIRMSFKSFTTLPAGKIVSSFVGPSLSGWQVRVTKKVLPNLRILGVIGRQRGKKEKNKRNCRFCSPCSFLLDIWLMKINYNWIVTAYISIAVCYISVKVHYKSFTSHYNPIKTRYMCMVPTVSHSSSAGFPRLTLQSR
jgi:hypothetical protein